MPPKPKATCRNGHKLKKPNLIIHRRTDKKTGAVKIVRECRECANARYRRTRRAARLARKRNKKLSEEAVKMAQSGASQHQE
jgi:hypothetical protein